jgi:hypothetical protein
MGDALVRANVRSDSTDDAVSALRQACEERSDATCCLRMGELHILGQVADRDDSKALSFFAKACDAGRGEGCWNAGKQYHGGFGVPKDLARVVILYERGCSLGFTISCTTLAVLDDREPGVCDPGKVKAALERGCTAGDLEACGWQSRKAAKKPSRPAR